MWMKIWTVVGTIVVALMPQNAAATTYVIDPMHTYPSLEMPHMGLSIWRGKFDKTSGTVVYDAAAKTGSVDINVATTSIDFGLADMHAEAIKAEWLDVEKYPTMTYKGTLRFDGDKPAAIDGQLTLRGVTKPLVLKINSFKCIEHPYYKKQVCGADAEGDVDRAEYGMTQYTQEGAGILHLRIQVEGIKKDE
jgi:polyisoprenoid-binding protein YceI